MKTSTILLLAAAVLGLAAILKSKSTAAVPLTGYGQPYGLPTSNVNPIGGAISGLLGGLFGKGTSTLTPSNPTFTGSTAGQPIYSEYGVQIPSNVGVGSVSTIGTDEESFISDPGFSIDSGASLSSSAFDDYES